MGKNGILVLIVLLLGVGGFLVVFMTGQADLPPDEPTTTVEDDENLPEIPPTPEEGRTFEGEAPPDENAPAPVAEAGPKNMVTGTVYDQAGKPVAGAKIKLFQYIQKRGRTYGKFRVSWDEKHYGDAVSDEDGVYSFEGLEVAAPFLTMRLKKPGFVSTLKDKVGPGMTIDFHLDAGARITGTITDLKTKKPIPGVRVEGNFKNASPNMHDYRRWREAVTTDAEGRYEFTGAPDGNITLLLEHELYERMFIGSKQKLTVVRGTENVFDFEMNKGLVFAGQVIDSETKLPVKDAEVQLMDLPFLLAERQKTGVFGKFKMIGCQRGPHDVKIRADGYTQWIQTVDFNDEDFGEDDEMKIELLPAGTASGTVVDADGNPVEGAEIYVAEKIALFNKVRDFAETRTDAFGKFTVKNLNNGKSYTLTARAAGYALGSSDTFDGITGEDISDVIIQLDPGATVQGRVLDEVGVPVKDVQVIVEQPPYAPVWFPPGLTPGQKTTFTLVTDESGVFSAEGLYTGIYYVTPEHENYVPVSPKRFQIQSTSEVVSHDFTLKVGHTISGRVTDQYGNAMKGAKITAQQPFTANRKVTATSDENGEYTLRRLQEMAYRVRAESNKAVGRAIEDVPSDSTGIDFVLLEWGKIKGRVVGRESAAPVTRFNVRISPMLEPEDTGEKRDLTDRMTMKKMRSHESFRDVEVVSSRGEFTIDKVEPGEYLVEVYCDTHRDGRQVGVYVQPGAEAQTKPFVLTEGARFEGYIKDGLGNPVAPGSVRMRLNAPPGARTVTRQKPDGSTERVNLPSLWEGRNVTVDEEGFFSIGGLPPGKIRIMFMSDEYCVPASEETSFGQSGTTRKDYTVKRGGKITVLVKDEDGAPVPNCSATVNNMDGSRAKVDGRVVAGRGDSSGNLKVKKVEPGTYLVLIRRYGYELKEVEVSVLEGEEAVKEVTLLSLH